MELTIAYPVQVGLNFIMVIALSLLYLGENLTMEKGIGIGLVIGSIYFYRNSPIFNRGKLYQVMHQR